MLAEAKLRHRLKDTGSCPMQRTKNKIYVPVYILDHLVFEGYSSKHNPYLKEVNIHDLVLYIISQPQQ